MNTAGSVRLVCAIKRHTNEVQTVCVCVSRIYILINGSIVFCFIVCRSGGSESAGRRICEWASAAGLRTPAHRRAGTDGRATVRYLAATARFAW